MLCYDEKLNRDVDGCKRERASWYNIVFLFGFSYVYSSLLSLGLVLFIGLSSFTAHQSL